MTSGTLAPSVAPAASSPRSPFARIVAWEWRLLRAERVVLPVILLLAVAAAFAIANGRAWSDRQRDAAAAAARDEATRFATLDSTLLALAADTTPVRPFGDPRAPYAAGQGLARRFVILPQAPLAPLAVGQSDLFPSYYRTSFTSRTTFFANDEPENPRHLEVGRFDLAFVIVFLLPLIVFALSYNLLSSERESGILTILLAQPVRLRTLLAAKLFTRASLVIALTVALIVTAALAGGIAITEGEALGDLARWTGLAVLYALFWFALALLVNVRGRSSASNALVLLGVWLAAVVAIPATLNVVTTSLHPTPSRVELMQASRDATNEASARGSQLLAMYLQDHPELMQGGVPDPSGFATRALIVADEVSRAVQPIRDRFDQELLAQQRLVDRWRWLSPALVTQIALVDLAGTGSARYRDFGREADRFVAALRAFYAPRILRGERMSPALLATLPDFSFDDRAMNAARRDGGWVMLALLAGGVALTVLALVRVHTDASSRH